MILTFSYLYLYLSVHFNKFQIFKYFFDIYLKNIFQNVVRIAIIFEQCFMIKIFDFHIENIVFDELFSIDLPENILDITFIDKKSLLSITR